MATTLAAATSAAQPSQDRPATLSAAFERSAAAVCMPPVAPLIALALMCVPEGYEVDGTRSCEMEGIAVPTSLFLSSRGRQSCDLRCCKKEELRRTRWR